MTYINQSKITEMPKIFDTSNPRKVVGQAIPACAFGEEQRNAAWAMTVAIDEGHPKESKRWKKSIPTSHYRMGPHS